MEYTQADFTPRIFTAADAASVFNVPPPKGPSLSLRSVVAYPVAFVAYTVGWLSGIARESFRSGLAACE